MGFLERLRAHRLEQRKANKPQDENYYFSDSDMPEIISMVTKFFSEPQMLRVPKNMDNFEMREYIEGGMILGYKLKHRSKKYSVANRPMYYGV